MLNDVDGIVLDQCQCGTMLFGCSSHRSIYGVGRGSIVNMEMDCRACSNK